MEKKHICIGLLAHVDAGKTTLSEAMLYRGGAIQKLGRVDHRNAFLDTDEIERERGITVFSKQARFSTEHCDVLRSQGGVLLERWRFDKKLTIHQVWDIRRREQPAVDAFFLTLKEDNTCNR